MQKRTEQLNNTMNLVEPIVSFGLMLLTDLVQQIRESGISDTDQEALIARVNKIRQKVRPFMWSETKTGEGEQ
ncbi:MAG TPA: hypothetical protein ENH30_01525 [Nitrospirae bacterium]|nr:hypothetical protein [Nitrospirota bacterium]